MSRTPGLISLTGSAFLAVLFVLTAASALSQDLPGALKAAGGYVFTADELGASISRIDLQEGTVETVSVPIGPHNVQVVAGGKLLLAVGEAASSGPEDMEAHDEMDPGRGGLLLVLDPRNLTAPPLASVVVGSHPAHVVADETGLRAFVTNGGDNTVSVIDLETYSVVAEIGTGASPHGQRVSPDGTELYVADAGGDTVSVIDLDSLRESARISVGRAPVQVGFTPDGRRAYVSLRDDDMVAVLDTATRDVVSKIAVGNGPIQLHATADGRFVYVANQGTETSPGETVSVIDTTSLTVVSTIRTGAGTHGVAVSDEGGLVFVTNIYANTVSVIDSRLNSVVATFDVGRGPNGVTYLAPAR